MSNSYRTNAAYFLRSHPMLTTLLPTSCHYTCLLPRCCTCRAHSYEPIGLDTIYNVVRASAFCCLPEQSDFVSTDRCDLVMRICVPEYAH